MKPLWIRSLVALSLIAVLGACGSENHPTAPPLQAGAGYGNSYPSGGNVNWNGPYSGGNVNWGYGGGSVQWGGPRGGGGVQWGSGY
jgi:hypothetical protein